MTRIRKVQAMRKASTLARRSLTSKKRPSTASEFIKAKRSSIELEILQLQLELDILNSMTEMNENEKLETTFSLMDVDNDRKIDTRELGDGLRTIQDELESEFSDLVTDSVKAVVSYDKDSDGQLNIDEFRSFIDNLAMKSSSTYEETLEMSMFALFMDNAERQKVSSSTKIRTIREVIAEEEVVREEELRTETRMRALFDIFDTDGSNNIDFAEFVLGIYKITDDMSGTSKAAMEVMLMFDQDKTRSLSFEGFAKVINNLYEASPDGMDLDGVLDIMTTSIILSRDLTVENVMQNATDDSNFLQISQMGRISELDFDDFQNLDSTNTLEAIEYAKIYRLYKLWDLDDDDLIDFKELLLGLRKFQSKVDVVNSVDDACVILNKFDEDGDQELDFSEFASFIAEYTSKIGIDLHELLDCMIVTTALKKNKEEDINFLNMIEIKEEERESQ